MMGPGMMGRVPAPLGTTPLGTTPPGMMDRVPALHGTMVPGMMGHATVASRRPMARRVGISSRVRLVTRLR
jgi:hypothetical protein